MKEMNTRIGPIVKHYEMLQCINFLVFHNHNRITIWAVTIVHLPLQPKLSISKTKGPVYTECVMVKWGPGNGLIV